MRLFKKLNTSIEGVSSDTGEEAPYMSNTGNLTPIDKSTFRWFRWIHRTNVYSVGEVFSRWKINDIMTHGKQISVLNLDCPMDPSDKQVYYRTNNFPMDI